MTNWAWFLDLPPDGTVFDATEGGPDIAAQITAHFSEVRHGSLQALSDSQESFDAVVVHDNLHLGGSGDVTAPDTLSSILSALKPAGWLVATSTNPSYMGGGRRTTSGIRASAFTKKLTRAGFRDVRRLHATPSLERPINLVPDSDAAVRAFETSPAMQDTLTWSRRAVVALGLTDLLYPGYVIMAQK